IFQTRTHSTAPHPILVAIDQCRYPSEYCCCREQYCPRHFDEISDRRLAVIEPLRVPVDENTEEQRNNAGVKWPLFSFRHTVSLHFPVVFAKPRNADIVEDNASRCRGEPPGSPIVMQEHGKRTPSDCFVGERIGKPTKIGDVVVFPCDWTVKAVEYCPRHQRDERDRDRPIESWEKCITPIKPVHPPESAAKPGHRDVIG